MKLVLAPLTVGLALAGIAQAQQFCEHDKMCAVQEYGVFRKDVRCPSGSKSCVSNYAPPGVDSIDCSFDGNGYSCEIWPRGDGLSYSYWGSSMLQVSDEGPTESSFVYVGCVMPGRSGTLTVTVTSPYGLSSSDSIGLPCRWLQEN